MKKSTQKPLHDRPVRSLAAETGRENVIDTPTGKESSSASFSTKMQTLAQGSPQVQRLAQLQAMADQRHSKPKESSWPTTQSPFAQIDRVTQRREMTQRKAAFVPAEAEPAQLAKRLSSPKALKYTSYSGDRRDRGIRKMRRKQHSLNRGRRLHVRHIIPHSDLQAWMMEARRTGGALSNPGLMRREIYNLLIFLGENGAAANWQNGYNAYENGAMNRSFLQEYNDLVSNTWRLIEWHRGNIFLGHGGINMAIQNRFDAGRGAVQYRGQAYLNNLHAIWHAANTLLGLNPTAIQDTLVYSTYLQRYIVVRAAEHANSRNVIAAVGWLGRSDYIRSL